MATDFEPLIQLVHHILHRGHEEGMHTPDVLDRVFTHFLLATGRKFSLLAPSQDESEIR